MKITGELWGEDCANGDDCEKVYDMDGALIGIRFRWDRVLTTDQAAALGVDLPAHEGMMLYPRQSMER